MTQPALTFSMSSMSSMTKNSSRTKQSMSRMEFRQEQEAAKRRQARCKSVAFVAVGLVTLGYSLCEIGVGVWLGTLVLLSDGFHNLSDVIALGVGLWANKASRRSANFKYTYGTKRTELIGALINGSFLLALCLYIVLETIPRFVAPEAVSPPGVSFVVIAAIGLAINISGTIIFAITGSHGHAGHSHKKVEKVEEVSDDNELEKEHDSKDESHDHEHEGGEDFNIKALFLHFLGDALSSLFVLATSLLIYFFPPSQNRWVLYIDPAASIIVVVIILWTTIPLVRTVSRILLQSSSDSLDVERINAKLEEIPGVVSVHDLHIWELVDGMAIGSLHVDCSDPSEFEAISSKMKKIFHKNGIHCVTIQPEFVESHGDRKQVCVDMCVEDCLAEWCCQDETWVNKPT